MKYLDLRNKIYFNIFTLLDVFKIYPEEKETSVKMQLHRLAEKRLITKIKKGVYCFDPQKIDELSLANHLYSPSYISMESALSYYGIIPDIPLSVTSITLTTTKKIRNKFSNFFYHKIKKDLFFGYKTVESPDKTVFNIALKEKALLDYIYIRKIPNLEDARLSLSDFDKRIYNKFRSSFPPSVRKVRLP